MVEGQGWFWIVLGQFPLLYDSRGVHLRELRGSAACCAAGRVLGQGGGAGRGSVASLVLLAGVNKPH